MQATDNYHNTHKNNKNKKVGEGEEEEDDELPLPLLLQLQLLLPLLDVVVILYKWGCYLHHLSLRRWVSLLEVEHVHAVTVVFTVEVVGEQTMQAVILVMAVVVIVTSMAGTRVSCNQLALHQK